MWERSYSATTPLVAGSASRTRATIAEAGFPDLVGFIVWGFAVPAGTPDDIVKILNETTNRALQSERVKRVMVDNAYFVSGGTPDGLWSAFDQQISEFTEIMKAGGIKFE